MLQSKLLGDRNQWAGAVMTWSRLQGELAGRRMTTPDATSATLEVTRKKEEEERRSEEQQEEEEEEKCDVESRKSAGEQREEERGNGRLSAVHALEKKRKRDDEEEEEEERRGAARDFSSEKNVNTSETERRREGEEEMGMLVEFSSCRKNGKHGVISRADHSVESTNRRVDDVSKNFAVESVENSNNNFFLSF